MAGSEEGMPRPQGPLIATLEAMGVGAEIAASDDWQLLACAPPEDDKIGHAYQQVNDHLSSLLKRGPISVAHVTGEARALLDPAHRRVLRSAHKKGQPSMLACSFSTRGEPTAADFVVGERQHWRVIRWFDLVDMLSLAASKVVRIYRLHEAEKVHFSLFDDDLVLLQSPHDHPTSEKWVWFIKSRPLAAQLRPHLQELFEQATLIEPRTFDQILDWLHEYETFERLDALARQAEGAKHDVGQRAEDRLQAGTDGGEDETDSRDTLDPTRAHLMQLGFVESGGEELTPLGREWIQHMETLAR